MIFISDDAIDYIDLWTAPLKELKIFEWATLRTAPTWKNVEAVMIKLSEHALYDSSENATNLHIQFGYVKKYCAESKIKQWNDANVSTENRWVEIFNHLHTAHCEYTEMGKILEYILCLPGTSAAVERLFAAINKTWTDEKSQLHIVTLNALIMVKFNIKLPCTDFYDLLQKQPSLLRQIAAKDKYRAKTATGEIVHLEDGSDDSDNEN